jgi:hypothetical protein
MIGRWSGDAIEFRSTQGSSLITARTKLPQEPTTVLA